VDNLVNRLLNRALSCAYRIHSLCAAERAPRIFVWTTDCGKVTKG
jgi:hypothetical protein